MLGVQLQVRHPLPGRVPQLQRGPGGLRPEAGHRGAPGRRQRHGGGAQGGAVQEDGAER